MDRKMDRYEKVEKIREKTGVSYEEARNALDAAEGDILDALVYLENQGKIPKPDVQYYSTDGNGPDGASGDVRAACEQHNGQDRRDGVETFMSWVRRVLKKSWENHFVVEKNEKQIFQVPILVLILLLLSTFGLTVILLIVGLFTGFRYSFRGELADSININDACDKASRAAESVKAEFEKDKGE